MKFLPILLLFAGALPAAAAPAVRNVILVTIDGLRWQEVFGGADAALIDKDNGGVPEGAQAALKREFLAATPEERRARLMPFFWSTVPAAGQVFGNRARDSRVEVANAENISYPGYNELLTGRADPLITSNTPIPNPNVTVLEWLHGRPGYADRVAAVAQWRVFTSIMNVGRSRLPVWVTDSPLPAGPVSPRLRELERWMTDIPPIAAGEHFDAFVYESALDHIARLKPRVLLVAFGEPDSWAHARRYDRYLQAAQRCDRFVRQLWEHLQTLPEYRGTTAVVLSPDHGRGTECHDWTSHGKKIPRSEETWLAAFGPGIAPRGERESTPLVRQAQIAATVAALLGEDWLAAAPGAAPPVPGLLAGQR
jgi:hypothetical protein